MRFLSQIGIVPAVALVALAFGPCAGAYEMDKAKSAGDKVALWGRFERTFTATGLVPYETELTVEFIAPSGKKYTVPGFWDDDRTWRVRFMPLETGAWQYRTRSRPAIPGLDGESGQFECHPSATPATALLKHGPVRVASGAYHLEHADGTPFFWLGDTVWTGPAFSSQQDWQTYLEARAADGYSVVQFNAICPWRTAPTDADGQTAFIGHRGIRINPKYFRRLDERMDAINAAGLVAAPVLLWANKGTDPGNYLSEEDAIALIRYEVARYGAHHVVWILAGDNPYDEVSAERWKRIGRAVFGAAPHAPVLTHPTGGNWPWETWNDEKWLDILAYQSGHGDSAATLTWLHSGPQTRGWERAPARPIINLEPPYEDHLGYESRKPHSAYNVRRAVYWSLLRTPTAGVTYGGHGLWSWQTVEGKTPPDHAYTGVAKTWWQALEMPGSKQMRHVAELFKTLPWWHLRPAQDLLDDQPGATDPARFVAAAQTTDGSAAVLYLPVGGTIVCKRQAVEKRSATWFDPRTGELRPAAAGADGCFEAPDTQDWILLLRKQS